MADAQPSSVSPVNLMMTGLTAQSFGGAVAIVWLAFHKLTLQNGIDETSFQSALALIAGTFFSALAMGTHIVLALVLHKYFPQTGEKP